MNDLSPFGFVDDGRELEDIIEPVRQAGWMTGVENDFL
jgi:hypothetical protein